MFSFNLANLIKDFFLQFQEITTKKEKTDVTKRGNFGLSIQIWFRLDKTKPKQTQFILLVGTQLPLLQLVYSLTQLET